ncbi:IucA/IucC family siderophore biosynthesis protein [Halobacillus sp. A5]|uniref:IucA/IucC family protein n=1 Tax=Halobacillus sp. A5 TaxID=2880263 RepID=UPI0020A6CC31|nr:IucA/IucC family protein [Halobacillus sp. A5]MCP3028203.1 IucA/IucC family siderophore biosynthesis protein [Halobacillus sp. A5]
MKNLKNLAEEASMQAFLNCYLRETGNVRFADEGENIRTVESYLSNLKEIIIAPVEYWSETGRHKFKFPIYLRKMGSLIKLDYITLVSTIIKELAIENNRNDAEDELMLRVILSCQKINDIIENRQSDQEELMDPTFHYIDAEQSLLLGHLMHPTPKSRQGLSEKEDELYSPELKGEFQLHYFKAKNDVVIQDSSLDQSASQEVVDQLSNDPEVNDNWLKETIEADYSLLPVHPLQAKDMLKNQEVKDLITQGKLVYLGPAGSRFKATSSFRTVYNERADYMFKFSLPIKITNSLRGNLQKELDRGVEVSRLINTEFGIELRNKFPKFRVLKDPAYLKLKVNHSSTAYDAVLRQNPFKEGHTEGVSLIAGLCQEEIDSGQSRLFSIVTSLARREGRSKEEVSKDWFKQYLSLSLDPLLWLFETYGLALEAHQQNSLVRLSGGYPEEFYYRDNQGYYFSESKAEKLKKYLPALNQSSDTICADNIAVERIRYYFFFNHLFGLVNSFGSNELVNERELLDILRERLQEYEQDSPLIRSLLNESSLPCKANLLTRFHDMDELQGSLAHQSVYTSVDNPLASKVGSYET